MPYLSATVYSWFVNVFISNKRAEKASADSGALNDRLANEIEQRTMLLDSVNEITVEMLGSGADGFEERLYSCTGKIGQAVDVHLIRIWKSEIIDGELMCTKIHEWTGGMTAPDSSKETVPFPPDWYPQLSENRCINDFTRAFPAYERERLENIGAESVIAVPLLLSDDLWGVIGYCDCKRERRFTGIEESILRTVSLLIAASVVRNDMTKQLISATEEALASSKAKSEFLSNMRHEIRTCRSTP